MNTHTFQTKDKRFTITVKKSFLKDCPNPETLTAHELCLHHKMIEFLHSLEGPAVIRHLDDVSEYWVDGNPIDTDPFVSEAEKKKLHAAIKFNSELKKL